MIKLGQKIGGVAVVLGSFALLAFIAYYVFTDLRYVFAGDVAQAEITSFSQEFAGFSEDDVRGTEAQFISHYTYMFEVDGVTYTGRESTFGRAPGVGESIPVRFIAGSPGQHRLQTSDAATIRFVIYWSIGIFILLVELVPSVRQYLISDDQADPTRQGG